MTLFIGFGAVSQWPLGWLSDKIDRRKVILLCCVVVTSICILLSIFEFSKTVFLILNGLIGASTLPLYSLGVAQTNDRLKPSQMVSASGTIIFVYSVFAALGPFSMSYFINLFDELGFLLYLSGVHILIAVIVFAMMFVTDDVDESDQANFQVMAQRPSVVGMEVIAEEALESQLDSD